MEIVAAAALCIYESFAAYIIIFDDVPTEYEVKV